MANRIFVIRYCKRPNIKSTLVNFQLSEDVLGLFSLYAVAHGQTVSNVLRAVCLTWMKDNQVSANVLTTTLTAVAQKAWDERKAEILPEFHKTEFLAFKERVRYELEEKKINTTYIHFVIKPLKP